MTRAMLWRGVLALVRRTLFRNAGVEDCSAVDTTLSHHHVAKLESSEGHTKWLKENVTYEKSSSKILSLSAGREAER